MVTKGLNLGPDTRETQQVSQHTAEVDGRSNIPSSLSDNIVENVEQEEVINTCPLYKYLFYLQHS